MTTIEKLKQESRMHLADVAREMGVTRQTATRWWRDGVGGIRLEAYRQVGRVFTSREALARFLADVEADRPSPADPVRAEVNSLLGVA